MNMGVAAKVFGVLTVLCVYLAEPPHDTGWYSVVMHQPDGGEIVDSVLVVPAL